MRCGERNKLASKIYVSDIRYVNFRYINKVALEPVMDMLGQIVFFITENRP